MSLLNRFTTYYELNGRFKYCERFKNVRFCHFYMQIYRFAYQLLIRFNNAKNLFTIVKNLYSL